MDSDSDTRDSSTLSSSSSVSVVVENNNSGDGDNSTDGKVDNGSTRSRSLKRKIEEISNDGDDRKDDDKDGDSYPPWFYQTARKCNRCGHIFHHPFTAQDFEGNTNPLARVTCPQCSLKDPSKLLFKCPYCAFDVDKIVLRQESDRSNDGDSGSGNSGGGGGKGVQTVTSLSEWKKKHPNHVLWLPHSTSADTLVEHIRNVHSDSNLIDAEVYCQSLRAYHEMQNRAYLVPAHYPDANNTLSPLLPSQIGNRHSVDIASANQMQQGISVAKASSGDNAVRKYAFGRKLGSLNTSPQPIVRPPQLKPQPQLGNTTPSTDSTQHKNQVSTTKAFVDMVISGSRDKSEVIVTATQYPKVFTDVISRYLSLSRSEDRVAMIRSNEMLRKVLLMVEEHCKRTGLLSTDGSKETSEGKRIGGQEVHFHYKIDL